MIPSCELLDALCELQDKAEDLANIRMAIERWLDGHQSDATEKDVIVTYKSVVAVSNTIDSLKRQFCLGKSNNFNYLYEVYRKVGETECE